MEGLRWLLQILSLDSSEKRVKNSEKCCYIFKGIFSILCFGVVFYFAIDYKLKHSYPVLNFSIVITDIVQMIYDYFQYIVDIFCIFKYGCETSQVYFTQYHHFDNILHLKDWTEVRQRVTRMLIFLLSFYFMASALDFTAWFLTYGVTTTLAYGFTYMFLLIKVLTNLDLTAQIIKIECRVRVIGDMVQEYYESCDRIPCLSGTKQDLGDTITNRNWFYADACERVTLLRSKGCPLKSISSNNCHEIKWLSRCYLLLNEQCNFINNFYGIRVLLNTLSLLIDMVRYLNISVRFAIGSQKASSGGYFPVASMLFRFLFCATLITSLTRHCENVYRQVERIQSVSDHILINKNPDAALRSSVTELRELVNTRPLSFNIAYFFKLSYPCLMSMASTVVTYTIILLQTVN